MSANPLTKTTASPLTRLLAGLIVLLIPVLLVLVSVRLVMSEAWLRFEYQRAGFPADRFGWDTDVRLEYGPVGIDYLLTGADISMLADLEIDGQTAFNADELKHMEDVQVVTLGAMWVLQGGAALFVLCAGALLWRPGTRPLFWRAVSWGGLLTLAIAGVLVLLAVFAWDFFFDTFHALFFEDGTWQFYTSDTLIRLYPQQFWFDSSLVVGILTLGGAGLCAVLPQLWLRRKAGRIQREESAPVQATSG